jgi:hypothetical protein
VLVVVAIRVATGCTFDVLGAVMQQLMAPSVMQEGWQVGLTVAQWCKQAINRRLESHDPAWLVSGHAEEDQTAIALLDNAPTLANPEALQIFRVHNVWLAALPHHLAHVLQPADAVSRPH